MGISRKHILLVEDNRDIRTAFIALFESIHDYALHAFPTTREAIGLTGRQNVDIAVVDLASGLETKIRLDMIRGWRSEGRGFPVIATSAHDYDGLSVESFVAGSDDFLRKPFIFGELNARIQRQLTRGAAAAGSALRVDGVRLPKEPFIFATAIISPDLRITFPSGRCSRLSAKQVGILQQFALNAGRLVLKDNLTYAVWGADANTNSTSVNQYIYTLRILYRQENIDLTSYVKPASKAGWLIAPCAVDSVQYIETV